MTNLILKLKAFASTDVIVRTVKTIVAVVAAEGAIYTTVVPNPPGTNTSVALAGGAGAITLVWNLLIQLAVKTRSAKLDKLAAAIDAIVDQRLTEQAMQNAAAKVPQP